MQTFVIFDIDGTLLYSNKMDSQCFAGTYKDIYRQDFPSIDWRKYPHVTDTTIFKTVIQEQFGRAVAPDEVEVFTDQYLERLQQSRIERPDGFREVPQARATVEYLLNNNDYAVGIATGGWERPARLKLAHVGVPTDLLYMSFADGKVSREEILQESIDLARQANIVFERIIYIGDAIWDVKTTRNMGLPFVGIRRAGDKHFLYDAGAKHVLTDFSDRMAFLDAVGQADVPGTGR